MALGSLTLCRGNSPGAYSPLCRVATLVTSFSLRSSRFRRAANARAVSSPCSSHGSVSSAGCFGGLTRGRWCPGRVSSIWMWQAQATLCDRDTGDISGSNSSPAPCVRGGRERSAEGGLYSAFGWRRLNLQWIKALSSWRHPGALRGRQACVWRLWRALGC